jgi:hypothetical protein
MPVDRHASLAGKLQQKPAAVSPINLYETHLMISLSPKPAAVPCRSQPAGESSSEVMPVDRHASLAGKLLQKPAAVSPINLYLTPINQ